MQIISSNYKVLSNIFHKSIPLDAVKARARIFIKGKGIKEKDILSIKILEKELIDKKTELYQYVIQINVKK